MPISQEKTCYPHAFLAKDKNHAFKMKKPQKGFTLLNAPKAIQLKQVSKVHHPNTQQLNIPNASIQQNNGMELAKKFQTNTKNYLNLVRVSQRLPSQIRSSQLQLPTQHSECGSYQTLVVIYLLFITGNLGKRFKRCEILFRVNSNKTINKLFIH